MENLGEYQVLEKIGSGNFAAVYKVELDGEIYAAKVPDSLKQFKNEAETMRSLEHPNIANILDFRLKHSPPFFVMEYVKQSLEDIIKPTKWEKAVEICSEILAGVEHAHSKDIVHGDIKPSNILLGEEIMISDFGLAKIIQEEAEKLRNTLGTVESLGGTFDYAAPEQIEGNLDKRNDLYSVGVILYQMLTGVLPKGLKLPSEIKPLIPSKLDDVVKHALEPINTRYQTAAEFKQDLEKLKPKKEQIITVKPGQRYILRNFNLNYEKLVTKKLKEIENNVKLNLLQVLELQGQDPVVNVSINNVQQKQQKIVYHPIEPDFREYGDIDQIHNLFTGKTQGIHIESARIIHKAISKAIQKAEWEEKPLPEAEIRPSKEKAVWYYPVMSVPINYDLNIEADLVKRTEQIVMNKPKIQEKIKEIWKGDSQQKISATLEFLNKGEFHELYAHQLTLDLILKDLERNYQGIFISNIKKPKFRYHVPLGNVLDLSVSVLWCGKDGEINDEAMGAWSVAGGIAGFFIGSALFDTTPAKIVGALSGLVVGPFIPIALGAAGWAVANIGTSAFYGIERLGYAMRLKPLKRKFDKAVKTEIKRLQKTKYQGPKLMKVPINYLKQ